MKKAGGRRLFLVHAPLTSGVLAHWLLSKS